jgi:hypothetical protein
MRRNTAIETHNTVKLFPMNIAPNASEIATVILKTLGDVFKYKITAGTRAIQTVMIMSGVNSDTRISKYIDPHINPCFHGSIRCIDDNSFTYH